MNRSDTMKKERKIGGLVALTCALMSPSLFATDSAALTAVQAGDPREVRHEATGVPQTRRRDDRHEVLTRKMSSRPGVKGRRCTAAATSCASFTSRPR